MLLQTVSSFKVNLYKHCLKPQAIQACARVTAEEN
jgi:hypothetical protein